MKKLYVGNLPFSVTNEGLKDLFSSFGEVTEATVVSDRNTGRSRGFGFVTLSDDEAAAKAIAEMNGAMLDGRALRVSEARPPSDRGERGGGGGGRRGGGFGRRDDW